MLTINEAMQRARQYGLLIRRANRGSTLWLVKLEEQRDGFEYKTDDIEDALFQGMKMRRGEYSFA